MSMNYDNPSDRRKYPERWSIKGGKSLFETIDVRSEDGSEELLSVSHITGITPRSQKNVTMFMSESLVGYKKCEIGDIAANTMWTWQGAIGVSKYSGVISPSYNVYRQKIDAYLPEYLELLLRERSLVDVYHSLSTGIRPSRLRLYPAQFLSIKFPVPSKEEQGKIVKYLNWQISKINGLLAIKKKQLNLVKEQRMVLIDDAMTKGIEGSKLKKSNIDGLAYIPETWEEKSLKRYVSSNDESLSGQTDDDYELDYIDISSVGFGYLKSTPEHMIFAKAPSRARRIVREGDTIISTVRTYLKSVCYIDSELSNCIVSTGFSVLRPKKDVYPKLLSYAICCNYFIDSVIRNSVGTSYPAINDSKLMTLKLALPCGLDEQKELFDYIAGRTAPVDSLLEAINAEIKCLMELKTKLISDVITGKIDVREVVVPDNEFVEEIELSLVDEDEDFAELIDEDEEV